MAFSFVYPTPLPSTKGWGPGWPSCQEDKIVPDDVFAGGVHRRIKKLVDLLEDEIKRRGYHFQDPGCWGFACRGTKGGSGDTPSFHSWGLALDFNAPQNPMNFDDPGAAFRASDIAQHNRWLVGFMKRYGFFWLGGTATSPIGDPMHFSFCGTPADADRMTKKAQADFAPAFTVKGKTFKSLGDALARAKKILQDGARAVRVRRK